MMYFLKKNSLDYGDETLLEPPGDDVLPNNQHKSPPLNELR